MSILSIIIFFFALLLTLLSVVSLLNTRIMRIENISVKCLFLLSGVTLLLFSHYLKEFVAQEARTNVTLANLSQTIKTTQEVVKQQGTEISGNAAMIQSLSTSSGNIAKRESALASQINRYQLAYSTLLSKVNTQEQRENQFQENTQQALTNTATVAQVNSLTETLTTQSTSLAQLTQQMGNINETVKNMSALSSSGASIAQSQRAQAQLLLQHRSESVKTSSDSYLLIEKVNIINENKGSYWLNSSQVKSELLNFASQFWKNYPIATYQNGVPLIVEVEFYGNTSEENNTDKVLVLKIISNRVIDSTPKYDILHNEELF